MGTKSFSAAGLDIGTSQITAVLAELTKEGTVSVLGSARVPSRGLRKGAIINVESAVADVAHAIQQVEASSGTRVRSVCASISGAHIKGFNSNGIVAVKGKEIRQLDVDRVLEAAKAVAIPRDREIFHVLPQEYIVDDQDGIREPRGISGVRLEARVHIVSGASASAQNVVNCVNRCGLTVSDMVLSSLAAGRSVLSNEERELGTGLIDLGGGTTTVAVFRGGGVRHTSVLPVGGNHITNDISAGLRTPLAAAETLKTASGSADRSVIERDEMVDVIPTGSRPHQAVPRIALVDIIEARVHEILTLIHRELVKANVEDLMPGGLVLTGGGALLSGIDRVAERLFGIPVRIGAPRDILGSADGLLSPQGAAAVGLVQHALEVSAGDRWYGGPVGSTGVIQRVGNWLAEMF